MPWKWSEAVPEGNGPVPQLEEFGSDEPTLEDAYRMIEELFNKSDRKLDELVEGMRATEQRLAGQEQDARQSRLTMEGGGPSDTKTRERTEGAAKAVQVMHEDRFSANEVDPDPMCSTIRTSRSLLQGDILVENGAAAPKSCLSPLEVRSPVAAGGLLPTGEASTTTRIPFNQPRLRFCPTEENSSKRTSSQYALYHTSF